MRIEDLRRSISEMGDDEALECVLQIRNARLVGVNKFIEKAKQEGSGRKKKVAVGEKGKKRSEEKEKGLAQFNLSNAELLEVIKEFMPSVGEDH